MKVNKVTYTTVEDTIETSVVTFSFSYNLENGPKQIDFNGSINEITYSGTVYAANNIDGTLRYSVAGGTISKLLLDKVVEKANYLLTNYETIK